MLGLVSSAAEFSEKFPVLIDENGAGFIINNHDFSRFVFSDPAGTQHFTRAKSTDEFSGLIENVDPSIVVVSYCQPAVGQRTNSSRTLQSA